MSVVVVPPQSGDGGVREAFCLVERHLDEVGLECLRRDYEFVSSLVVPLTSESSRRLQLAGIECSNGQVAAILPSREAIECMVEERSSGRAERLYDAPIHLVTTGVVQRRLQSIRTRNVRHYINGALSSQLAAQMVRKAEFDLEDRLKTGEVVVNGKRVRIKHGWQFIASLVAVDAPDRGAYLAKIAEFLGISPSDY